MPDEQTPATPAVPATPAAPVLPDPKSGEGDDDYLKMTQEELYKANKALRSEIAGKRQDAKAAKEEAKTAKEERDALKAEKEKAELEKKKANGEWEAVAKAKEEALAKADERTIRAELKLYAQKEGILDPSDVKTVDIEGLKINEDGEVVGAEKLIAKLKAAKPHWFKSAEPPAAPPDPKSTTSPAPLPPPGTPGKKDLSQMTKAELEEEKNNFYASFK